MTQPITCLLALILLTLVTGCAKTPSGSWERRIEPNYDSQTIIDEAQVSRNEPHILISPGQPPRNTGPGLVFPCQVRQDIKHPARIGRELGRIMALTWSKQATFSRTLYAAETTWPGLQTALSMAADRGAAFIIRPVLQHLLIGGSQGTTSVALSVEIYAASNGSTLWSMAHAGRMDSPPDRDYIFYTRTVRLPAAPEYAVMTVLAEELGEPVRRWRAGEAAEKPGK
jgi:hypothetical protein